MDHTFLIGHNHELTEITEDDYCRFCWSTEPTAYWRCSNCDTPMCMNCVKLPQEASHWLHPQHLLRLNSPCSSTSTVPFKEKGICEGCNHFLHCHIGYKCTRCEFCLCVECCTSTTSRRPLQWENRKLLHYNHVHELTRCRFREGFELLDCSICQLKMWGVGYACVRCLYFVHESCIDTPQLIQHPFHPLHSLRRLDYKSHDASKFYCNACGYSVYGWVDSLHCYDCKFFLHSHCADYVLRAIKFECHTHGLICFRDMSVGGLIGKECPICGKDFVTHKRYRYPFFRCVECNLNFHFDCVSIPQSFKHGHHQHALTLMDPCDNDNMEDYYCDICEARRDPERHAYRCEQCHFFGHIECVLSQEGRPPQFLLSLEAKQPNKDELPKPPNYSNNRQIQHVCHDHPLNLKNTFNRCCCMCELKINGLAYTCENCDEEFWAHENCAELPKNLDHPLHQNHNLSLLKSCQLNHHGYFICSLCREITRGFNFSCRTCNFVIDIRCALTIGSLQPFDSKENKISFWYPIHRHELTLANARRDTGLEFSCYICKERCLGITYCCMDCDFYVHQACVEWPSMVEPHLLHPEHRLKLSTFAYGFDADDDRCYACGDFLRTLGYACEEYEAPNWKCRIAFHLECGISFARPLEQKHNEHHFYYFHKQPRKGVPRDYCKICLICWQETKGSYYRCRKCKICFHLGCLCLPHTAKHEWHLHWLIFKDSVDYGGYYCDICEEPRDLQHPFYCCEECVFVAHVECIVSKENASRVTLEQIVGREVNIPQCSPDWLLD